MSRFLTATELARVFQVQPSTILAWRRRGLISSLRPSRPLLFDLEKVIDALSHDSRTTSEPRKEA